jgi:large subunit ribosomal protein L28
MIYQEKSVMPQVCQVTGKRPMSGNNVSHANNRTRRRFIPNLQKKRFWLEDEKRYVTLRVSTKGMRTIDKHGIEKVLKDIKTRDLAAKAKKLEE